MTSPALCAELHWAAKSRRGRKLPAEGASGR